jgi:hypothetical protein
VSATSLGQALIATRVGGAFLAVPVQEVAVVVLEREEKHIPFTPQRRHASTLVCAPRIILHFLFTKMKLMYAFGAGSPSLYVYVQLIFS